MFRLPPAIFFFWINLKQAKIVCQVTFLRLVVFLNGNKLIRQDVFSVFFDNEDVVWLLFDRDIDFLLIKHLPVGRNILIKDLLDTRVVQDTIVWHLEWFLTESVTLVDRTNLFVQE